MLQQILKRNLSWLLKPIKLYARPTKRCYSSVSSYETDSALYHPGLQTHVLPAIPTSLNHSFAPLNCCGITRAAKCVTGPWSAKKRCTHVRVCVDTSYTVTWPEALPVATCNVCMCACVCARVCVRTCKCVCVRVGIGHGPGCAWKEQVSVRSVCGCSSEAPEASCSFLV